MVKAAVVWVLFGACGAACGDDERGAVSGTDTGTILDVESSRDAHVTDIAPTDGEAEVEVIEADGAGDDSADVVPDALEPDTFVPPDTVVLAETTPGACFDGATAGHHSVKCGEITFEVEVPDACTTRGVCGLIVDIHGWTMTAELEDLNTDMRKRGRDAGYVVVQPTAPLFVGIPTWDLAKHADPIYEFAVEVATALGTDPDRAHVMGFSQGGGLTWSLVCKHADFFASAAPIGALPGCKFSGQERPSREVDMLVVHGKKDAVVNFSQAESQRDDALAYWPLGGPAIFSPAGDATYTATRWTTPAGSVFEFWAHDYEAASIVLRGHCFPGSTHAGNVVQLGFGCAAPNGFNYAEAALSFFQSHMR